MDSSKFITKFKALPQPIRDWMGSEEVFLAATNIYDHFGLIGEKATLTGAAIKELLIGDLEPKHFAGKISNLLSLDKDRALLISKEIKRLIFSPLKADFQKANINIDDFDVFEIPIVQPKPASFIPKAQDIAPAKIPTTAPSPAASPVTTNQPKPAAPAFVFLKQEIKPIVPQKEIKIATPVANKGINFIAKAPVAPAPSATSAPKAAQIQIGIPSAPKQPEIAKTEAPKIKVVHYSQMKSPVPTQTAPTGTPAPASLGEVINRTSTPSFNQTKTAPTTPGFTPLRPIPQFTKPTAAPAQSKPEANQNASTPKPPIPVK